MIESEIRRGAGRMVLLLVFLLVTLFAASMVGTKSARASTTFTVNSTGDAGDNNPGNGTCATQPFPVGTEPECTVRAAIEETNGNDDGATTIDEIHFDIPEFGVQIISPHTGLPIITEPVVIDGYTQPGASKNTLAVGDNAVLLIRLDGSDAGNSTGLDINVVADDCVVRGLSITNFSNSAGITLSGTTDATIEGNFLGTSPGGTKSGLGNGDGLDLQKIHLNLDDRTHFPFNNTIGGDTLEARNVISGNNGYGVSFFNGTGNEVVGNLIGTDKSGIEDLGNGASGIEVLAETRKTLLGGTGAAKNTIAFNGHDGVELSGAISINNIVLGDSIFSNGGLGIDLGDSGRTPNDPGDADTGANGLQNFPVLSSATTARLSTTIKGTLDSSPSQTFTLQFYSNPSGSEGKKFLGLTTARTDAGGKASFTIKLAKKVTVGQRITATATGPLGNTSEFSPPRRVVAP
jgi:CSLREA domain-containing protein